MLRSAQESPALTTAALARGINLIDRDTFATTRASVTLDSVFPTGLNTINRTSPLVSVVALGVLIAAEIAARRSGISPGTAFSS